MPTEQFINSLVLNKVDKLSTLEAMDAAGLINDDEFYLVEEEFNRLIIDNEPTKDSEALVTSGGVYEAIENITPGAIDAYTKAETDAAIAAAVSDLGGFTYGPTAPASTKMLWIDSSANGVMKFHNGTEWVVVTSAWQ